MPICANGYFFLVNGLLFGSDSSCDLMRLSYGSLPSICYRM